MTNERFWVAIFAVTVPSGKTITVASTPQQTHADALAHGAWITRRPGYSAYRLNCILRVVRR